MSGFTQLRRGALEALPAPSGRRDGHHLAAAGAMLILTCQANWRSGWVAPYRVTSWARDHGFPYRRARRALTALEQAGVARVALRAFHPGEVHIARDKVVHDQGAREERFVQVSSEALEALATEHRLSWRALSLLVALLLLVDHRDWTLGDWTLEALGAHLGCGYRSLRRALAQLAERGLVSFQPNRGKALELHLSAGPAVVVAPLPRQPKRRERRALARPGADGPVGSLARRLLAHWSLDLPPTPALLEALGALLAQGLNPEATFDHLVATGALTGARDPMAVLVARARRLLDHLEGARAEEHERRRRLEAERAAREEARRAEDEEAAATAEEGRWLGEVLGDDLLAKLWEEVRTQEPLGRGRTAFGVAGLLLDSARAAAAAIPDLDPAQVVRARLGISDLAWDEEGDRTPLPRSRDGPSLIERLSTLRR